MTVLFATENRAIWEKSPPLVTAGMGACASPPFMTSTFGVVSGAATAAAAFALALVAALEGEVLEIVVGGSGGGRLRQFHFYRVQRAVDVDILGLGWVILGASVRSLGVVTWGSKSP